MTSNASRTTVRRVGNSNSLELLPNSTARRNHIRVRKGLGLVHRSPPKKRSQAHHAVAVTCPLKDARRKALLERFSQLKGGSSNTTNVSTAETSNDSPMDVDDDYVDVEDEQCSREPHKHKRDTQGEAQRLYDAWRGLIPSLVLPFLAYMNKSACRPTANTFKQDNLPCSTCASDSCKTTRVLCLFWDRKSYVQSFQPPHRSMPHRSRNDRCQELQLSIAYFDPGRSWFLSNCAESTSPSNLD
jgi:hypothetical protein